MVNIQYLYGDKQKYNAEYQDMLVSEKFYTAMAFLKSLSKDFPYYESVYRQTAYALNDPMEKCSYSSDNIISAWISGSRDKTAEFKSIYEKEKLLMMSPNKPYNTKDSSEYFAEFYKEYCLDPTALKKQRSSTYEAIVTAVNCLNNMSETYLFSIKRAYEKTCWN